MKSLHISMLQGVSLATNIKVNARKGGFKLLGMFFLLCFVPKVKAQDRLELGFMVGTSYYFGDLNPGKQFYQPSLAYGGVARYVLNDRYALKGSLSLVQLKGSYPDNGVVFPEGNVNYSFARKVGDAALQVEFNFRSYDHWFVKNSNFTPFVSLGLGTAAYKRFDTEPGNSTEQTVFILSLPFGAGLKYKINQRIRVGVEWNFRKTFVDDLDVVGSKPPIDPSNPYGFGASGGVHDNDWYSYAGATITFSLFKRKAKCNGGF